jgi:hypothetical protein
MGENVSATEEQNDVINADRKIPLQEVTVSHSQPVPQVAHLMVPI